jgi:hypothetical protein
VHGYKLRLFINWIISFHSTLFIIGVLGYWSDGSKGLFDISKPLFPILQHSSPTYWDHIQDLEGSNYDRLKYKPLVLVRQAVEEFALRPLKRDPPAM